MTRRGRALLALGIGVAAGIAWPLVDLALSCRVPQSEACVWGKAYLPLTMAISVPVLGALVAWVAYALLTARGAPDE